MTFRHFSCQLQTCIYLMKIQIVIDTYRYKYTYTCIHMNVIFTNMVYINAVYRSNICPLRYLRRMHGRCRGEAIPPGAPSPEPSSGPSRAEPHRQSWPRILTPFVLRLGL